MPVTITINGESASETLHELRGLSGGLCGASTVTGIVAGAGAQLQGASLGQIAPDSSEAEKPARGRGRPRAATVSAVEGAPVQPTAAPQNISTSAERSNPESAQDQAETQSVQTAPVPEAEKAKSMTLDDVRNAAKSYIDKFGMEAAQKDLQDALEDAVGGGIRAISKLDGANQEQLGKAVQAFVNAATAANRYARPTASALG